MGIQIKWVYIGSTVLLPVTVVLSIGCGGLAPMLLCGMPQTTVAQDLDCKSRWRM